MFGVVQNIFTVKFWGNKIIIQLYWGQGWIWMGGGVFAEPGVCTYPKPTHLVKHGGHENYGHDHTR